MPVQEFPIGGSRQLVYDALRSRQFKQSEFSDKHWKRLDGLEVNIYGTGSRLLVRKGADKICDLPMAEALAVIDEMDAAANKGLGRQAS